MSARITPRWLWPLLLLWHPFAWATPLDQQVLAAALTHFAQRTDTHSSHEDGVVLVEPETRPLNLESGGITGLRKKPDASCDASAALLEDFVRRNSSAVSSANLVGQSGRWRIVQSGDLTRPRLTLDKTSLGEPIKTILALSLPGYSKDSKTAFVLLRFRWSIHGAFAQYVMDRSDNGWKIRCSDLAFML